VNVELQKALVGDFARRFGRAPEVVAYAPGRVEVLGNHTDYNEGFVLSAAIQYGTFFVVARSDDRACRVVARDIHREAVFALDDVRADGVTPWANYVKGVLAGLAKTGPLARGFVGMFHGDVPLGAGLSSSAALEMSAGTALVALYGLQVPPLELARIGQAAEHHYAGVKCGLLDQISSLYGREGQLVESDFRTLAVQTVAMGAGYGFLICNTGVKHRLVESEYNERRARCEAAARFFAGVLPHPVTALRDVSWAEWQQQAPAMEDVVARRAAHVVGENDRVLRGCRLLKEHRLAEFGQLMFESHESSRVNFENSCAELDTLVRAARDTGKVLGARLSGGGFGGSVVMLLAERDAAAVAEAARAAYARAHGHPCTTMAVHASEGARTVPA
jgi:galactokinase